MELTIIVLANLVIAVAVGLAGSVAGIRRIHRTDGRQWTPHAGGPARGPRVAEPPSPRSRGAEL